VPEADVLAALADELVVELADELPDDEQAASTSNALAAAMLSATERALRRRQIRSGFKATPR
jgi:hypothetical protein